MASPETTRSTGGLGNDILDGGLGGDRLVGGEGDDNYYVDDTNDLVVEQLNEGIDLVFSNSNYTLGANVESVFLNAAAAATLTGNELANSLRGNAGGDHLYGLAGNDILDGRGGADTMAGGLGDDSYYVDHTGDLVVEQPGEGNSDIVFSSISYTLGADVENLFLNVATGATLTGNGLANVMRGNAGNDTLNGLDGNDNLHGFAGNDVLDGGLGGDTLNGGLGNDTLTGGEGNDIIRFDTLLNASTNRDTITGYNPLDDTIQLENAIFTSLTTGGILASGSFVIGTVAVDGNDFVIYDDNTGALYYDADGSGAGAPVQFATLIGLPSLTSADFVVT